MTFTPYRPPLPRRPAARFAGGPLSYDRTVMADRPLGYWRLGDSSGGTTVAMVGPNASYGGGYTLNEAGALANDGATSVKFNGTDGGASSGLTFPAGTTVGVTMECWVKFNALGDQIHSFLLWGDQTPNRSYAWLFWDHRTGSADELVLQFWTSTNGYVWAVADWAPTTGVWYHVVAAHDYSAETVRFYIDGVLLSTYDSSANATPTAIAANESICLGAYGDNNGLYAHFMNGWMQEAAIYGHALSAYHVAAHYRAGRPSKRIPLYEGASFFAPLDEPSGSPKDLIGGLTGTANGTLTYRNRVSDEMYGLGDFASTSNYLTFPDDAALDVGDGPVSIAFWMRRDSDTGTWQIVLNKGSGAYAVTIGGATGDYADRITFGKALQATLFFTENWVVPADGSWHHYVVTRSAAGVGNTKFYVDSVDVGATEYASQGNLTIGDTTSPLEIGREGASSPLTGKVSHLGIWKRVLSPAEVKRLYLAGRGYAATILGTPGLSAYWRLGETSGTTAYDAAGTSALNGTYGGTYTLGATGLIRDDPDPGVSAVYAGRVDFPASQPLIHPGNTFSAEFWVDLSTVNTTMCFWSSGATGDVYLGITDTNKFRLRARGTQDIFVTTATFATGKYHVVFTKEGATSRIYVNGVDQAGTTTDYTLSPGTTAPRAMMDTDGSDGLYGTLDEIAIYNRALTAAEVRAHYMLGRPLSTLQNLIRAVSDTLSTLTDAIGRRLGTQNVYRDTVLADSPVSYWRLGEPSGVFVDSAGDNDLTAVGTVTRSVESGVPDPDDAISLPGGNGHYAADTTPTGLPTGGSARTIEAWVRLSTKQDYNCIAEYGTFGSGTSFGVFVTTVNDSSLVYLATGNNDINWTPTAGQFVDGRWHHVVVVLHDSTHASAYLDGVSSWDEGNGQRTINAVNTAIDTWGIRVGANVWGDSFDGALDEVAIYGYALTQTQIERHYRVGYSSLGRSVSDTIGSLTDSLVGLKIKIVALADSLSSLTDSLVRAAATRTRTAADSVGSLTDGLSRALTARRSNSDTVSSLTDAIVRVSNRTRTAADSLGSLTESVARVATLRRTTADSIGSLSDAIVALRVTIRTLGDSLSSITDSVTALKVQVRTAADSLSSLTESIARAASLQRTTADSVSSLSESLVRAAGARVRVAADSLSTLTESVARGASTRVRVASDTVSSLSDSLVRSAATRVRTAADSVGSLSESVVALKVQLRTVADSLSSISDSIARSGSFFRSTADSVGSITDALARTMAWRRTLSDSVSSISEAVVGLKVQLRNLADSVATISDSIARSVAYRRGIGDTVSSLTESIAPIRSFVRTTADAITSISDSVVGLKVTLRAIADSLGAISDSITRTRTLGRTASDSIDSIGEGVSRLATYGRSVADSVGSLAVTLVSRFIPFGRSRGQTSSRSSGATMGRDRGSTSERE